MGRHAKEATRSSVTRLIACSSVVLFVGGAGLLTYRTQPAPSANSVTTTAVVVSSLACTDGPGGTAVDVLNSAGPLAGDVVRASLDACGFQEGQQLTVQYPDGDPTQLSLADAVDDEGTAGRLLPIGLLIAALLAVAAGVAVWLDGRRGSRRPAHSAIRGEGIRGGAAQATTDPEQSAAAELAWPPAQLDDDGPSLAGLGFGEADWPAEMPQAGDTPRRQDAGALDLVFPFTSSLAESLHDELFTHRSVYN